MSVALNPLRAGPVFLFSSSSCFIILAVVMSYQFDVGYAEIKRLRFDKPANFPIS